ncbi:MAG: glycosyltransferase family 4 protein [Xenococcaceae cyanobacterium MO_188.B32]|nr:glycosyltransferase family 4 protein [Xenococcaceae cyanobacterium MO_188.B32]
MKNKIKVLYIVSTLRKCGPTNQLFYLIKYLDRQKFEPIVLTLSPEPEDSARSQFQQLEIAIFSLNLSRWQGTFWGASKLKSFANQHQPDIIHSQGIRPDTLAAKYLKNYKAVASIRNYPYHDYVMKYGKLIGYYVAQQHINALEKIKFPVSCSTTISQLINKHGIKSSIIRNGVDEDLYTPASFEEKIKLKYNLGLPLDTRIIVSVGALIPRKQPDIVIQGFLISQTQKDSILLMVGDGSLLASCQAIADNSSNIKFIGLVNNVVDYLKVADYFISASVSEGLPNSVIEALSCGVPVCLSDIEPHQEILNFNRQAGIMFSTGDVKDLGSRLDRLSNNHCELKCIARSIVSENLNAKKMSENYQNLYLTFCSS